MLANDLAKLAITLINKFGDDKVLKSKANTHYDINKHKNVSDENVISCKGVVDAIDTSELVSGVINITDMKVTMYTAIDSINKDYTIDDCPIIHIQKVGIQNKLIVYEVFIRCNQ